MTSEIDDIDAAESVDSSVDRHYEPTLDSEFPPDESFDVANDNGSVADDEPAEVADDESAGDGPTSEPPDTSEAAPDTNTDGDAAAALTSENDLSYQPSGEAQGNDDSDDLLDDSPDPLEPDDANDESHINDTATDSDPDANRADGREESATAAEEDPPTDDSDDSDPSITEPDIPNDEQRDDQEPRGSTDDADVEELERTPDEADAIDSDAPAELERDGPIDDPTDDRAPINDAPTELRSDDDNTRPNDTSKAAAPAETRPPEAAKAEDHGWSDTRQIARSGQSAEGADTPTLEIAEGGEPPAEEGARQNDLNRGDAQIEDIDLREDFELAQENAIADVLRSEGHDVSPVAKGPVRTPDATVDGIPTEFKSLDPGASDGTVKNQLGDAQGQARSVIIDARRSGLSSEMAELGIRRYIGASPGRMESVRIIGDAYDVRWP